MAWQGMAWGDGCAWGFSLAQMPPGGNPNREERQGEQDDAEAGQGEGGGAAEVEFRVSLRPLAALRAVDDAGEAHGEAIAEGDDVEPDGADDEEGAAEHEEASAGDLAELGLDPAQAEEDQSAEDNQGFDQLPEADL